MARMEFHEEITYPGADPDDVFGLAVNQKFREAVCAATRAVHHEVRIDDAGDGTASVRVTRQMPAEVPDLVKRFVGDTIEIVQHEEWTAPDGTGRRHATVEVNVTGQPASMTGTITLDSADGGCLERVEGEVSVSMPFIGPAMEPQLAHGLRLALEEEERVGRDWLPG